MLPVAIKHLLNRIRCPDFNTTDFSATLILSTGAFFNNEMHPCGNFDQSEGLM
jgi:hypothetical protein